MMHKFTCRLLTIMMISLVVETIRANNNEISYISQFEEPLYFKKLHGSNIYHLKFKGSNDNENLEECASMTKRLNGLSFDYWAFDCYINAGVAASVLQLERSDRYSYYQLKAQYHVRPNPENPEPSAPELGYDPICTKPTPENPFESCSAPPYEYPPVYTDSKFLAPEHDAIYENSFETDKLVKMMKENSKNQVFASAYFGDFSCTISFTTLKQLKYRQHLGLLKKRVLLTCNNGYPQPEIAQPVKCMASTFLVFPPEGSDSEEKISVFESFGSPDSQQDEIYLYHPTYYSVTRTINSEEAAAWLYHPTTDNLRPPCPADNKMIDFHDTLTKKMGYRRSCAKTDPLVPILQTQPFDQPNVRVPSELFYTVLGKKWIYQYSNEYGTRISIPSSVMEENGYKLFEKAYIFRKYYDCPRLLQMDMTQALQHMFKYKGYLELQADLYDRIPKPTFKEYVEILTTLTKPKPWLVVQLFKFMQEFEDIEGMYKDCFASSLREKYFKTDELELADLKTLVEPNQNRQKKTMKSRMFDELGCEWIANPSNKTLALACRDPRVPEVTEPTLEYNCFQLDFDKGRTSESFPFLDGACGTLNVFGTKDFGIRPSMGQSMHEYVIQKTFATQGPFCPPIGDLLSFHEKLAKTLKLTCLIGADTSLVPLLSNEEGPNAYVPFAMYLFSAESSDENTKIRNQWRKYGYENYDDPLPQPLERCRKFFTEYKIKDLVKFSNEKKVSFAKYTFLGAVKHREMTVGDYLSYLIHKKMRYEMAVELAKFIITTMKDIYEDCQTPIISVKYMD